MTNASNLISDNKTIDQNAPAVIKVQDSELSVCCPPIEQAHWNQHPRVYLDLKKNNRAKCPYCGNVFQQS
jgi:uncharacterized Zn-finger protein